MRDRLIQTITEALLDEFDQRDRDAASFFEPDEIPDEVRRDLSDLLSGITVLILSREERYIASGESLLIALRNAVDPGFEARMALRRELNRKSS